MATVWSVRGISSEAIENIQKQAKSRGLSIGAYLNIVFDGEDTREAPMQHRSWRIPKVRPSTIKLVVQNAKQRGISISDYLEMLAKEDKRLAEAQAKLNKIKEIIG